MADDIAQNVKINYRNIQKQFSSVDLNFSKELSKVQKLEFVTKWGGRLLAVYNAYDINEKHQAGQITDLQMMLEQGTNTVSVLGGIYGAAWGLGWELGTHYGPCKWYGDNDSKWFD